jgi:dihydroneopterin aldolase
VTRLLASVRDAAEARTALAAGADIIDLKDPASGALGALPRPLIATLVRAVGGRRPVSATVGDLPPDPGVLREAVAATAAAGVDFVKVGFFSARRLDACVEAVARAAAGTPLVAVLFADRSPPLGALPRFAAGGLAGVMIDTADKGGGRLLDHAGLGTLCRFVDDARAWGLICGLAGSLRVEDIPVLAPLAPDYLGFRGALCRASQRGQGLDRGRVLAVREALDAVAGEPRPVVG